MGQENEGEDQGRGRSFDKREPMSKQGLNDGEKAGGQKGELEKTYFAGCPQSKGTCHQSGRDHKGRKNDNGPLETIEQGVSKGRMIIKVVNIGGLFIFFGTGWHWRTGRFNHICIGIAHVSVRLSWW